MSVPMFFRLPEDFIIDFLSQWMDIRDLGRLDTAMTMHSLRPTFLQDLQRVRSTTVDRHSIVGQGTGLTSFKFLVWLSNRRIYVEIISVWPLSPASITEEKLPFLRQLHSTVSDSVSESDVVALLKSSPALQTISLYTSTRVQEVLRQIADHCPLLEELMLIYSFSMDDLHYLLNKCSALRNVTLHHIKEWPDDNCWERLQLYGHLFQDIGIHENAPNYPAFADFIGACPRLKALEYRDIPETSEGEILLRAAQTCPLLQSLSFDTHSSAALVALGRNCKKLRFVRVTGGSLSTSDLANLNQLENLETLILDQSDLTNGHLASICEYQNLKTLEIQQCLFEDIVTDGMFNSKPISRSLETIRIISRGAPAAALSSLTACSNLREIDLDDCRCDEAIFFILGAHFPLLERMTFGFPTEGITMEIFVAMSFLFLQHKDLEAVTFIRRNSHDEEVNAGFLAFLSILGNYYPHICFHHDYR